MLCCRTCLFLQHNTQHLLRMFVGIWVPQPLTTSIMYVSVVLLFPMLPLLLLLAEQQGGIATPYN